MVAHRYPAGLASSLPFHLSCSLMSLWKVALKTKQDRAKLPMAPQLHYGLGAMVRESFWMVGALRIVELSGLCLYVS